MRILLLGANGQVGHELRRSLAPLGEIVATTRSGVLDGNACELADFDVPDSLPILVERIAPGVVVNAAAYTAVDRAEDEPEAAFRANAESPGRLAEACARLGTLLLHYSTDYVFDGESDRPYREEDATGPLGVYGRSKLAGERAIQGAGCRHLIFRTAWVYGSYGANFMRTMLRIGSERDELRVVADQRGTPTSARLISDVSAEVLQDDPGRSGVWHLTAAGETSWHGFAEEIFRQAAERGLADRTPNVIPIATSEYPTRAKRPRYSCLDTTRLREKFGVRLPDWKQALTQVLDTSTH
ncbi:dTDP-4-dehydrorhamnose reductase [Pseudoxanthomonas sacheonensis]|uniref:dTDP-4-dehydrorhamnose reductase n=1 Tax=Pseudoxanthomonas sacheonensis TaxID=443615 RepID=A0ABU1RML6_9GAMM|nr:dTDP-4-dehydrorhamnose reductase [Pseudoxanthomonas sacheonensis]MDR6840018.1 dTDP-4-dehydrorhamnose reductase [Pseudoxanthomonas sacheonensis]